MLRKVAHTRRDGYAMSELAEITGELIGLIEVIMEKTPGARIHRIEMGYEDFRLGTSFIELRPRVLVELEDPGVNNA